MRTQLDLKKRLLSKIIVDANGCWNWQGATFKKVNGLYSQIRMTFGYKKHALRYAHRVSYEYFKGKVAEQLELDHLCRNTLCINPEHLEPVTHTENMRRRPDINKSHCKHGHEFNSTNIYVNPKGVKECRECRRSRVLKLK